MAHLILDERFINDHPGLLNQIWDKIKPTKVEKIKPFFYGLYKFTFHSKKLKHNEAAMLRIREHYKGSYSLGEIHSASNPFTPSSKYIKREQS